MPLYALSPIQAPSGGAKIPAPVYTPKHPRRYQIQQWWQGNWKSLNFFPKPWCTENCFLGDAQALFAAFQAKAQDPSNLQNLYRVIEWGPHPPIPVGAPIPPSPPPGSNFLKGKSGGANPIYWMSIAGNLMIYGVP